MHNNRRCPFFMGSILVIILFSLCACATTLGWVARNDSVSPYDFGWNQAKNGEERYEVLYKTHQNAVSLGKQVDYSGIKQADLTIPANAQSIPLLSFNDFCGVKFNVTNQNKDFSLFCYLPKPKDIIINKADIDLGSFYNYPELSHGIYLLVITDRNRWVAQRKNHDYGHVRKDVVLIKNGIAQNKTVMPYDNPFSDPSCVYYTLPYKEIVIKNAELNRTGESTHITNFCNVRGVNGLKIGNIRIQTPESTMVGDRAILISDCTDVTLDKVYILSTYSRKDHSGYGVSMNNIWKLRVSRMYGNGNWGVFGNNNINTATITDSEINRFDIHCYGRDVTFKRVKFFDFYNQFSSTYGTIEFDKCVFSNFTPILYETSYNSYVPLSVVFNNCEFFMTQKHNFLIDAGYLCSEINQRPELMEKCWPNVSVKRMKVIVEDDASVFNLIKTLKERSYNQDVGSIDNVSINGMSFYSLGGQTPIEFNIVNLDVNTDNQVIINVKRLDVPPSSHFNTKMNKGSNKTVVTIKKSGISLSK